MTIDNLAIIQARMGSTRLPGKVLLPLDRIPVLQHVIERVMHSKLVNDTVVATTINKKDIEIVKLVSNMGIRVFAGSENDVLDRYFQVAKLLKPKNIVRITADCPCIDPKIIDKVIEEHLNSDCDYTSNTIIETYPDGMDVEVFTYESLFYAWKNAKLSSEREHVTPFIRKNFNTKSIENDINLSHIRLTIDRKEDYELLKIIFDSLYKKNKFFGLKEIIEYLEKNPDILKINHNIVRNEGYIKSLKNDKTVNLDYLEED